jgi:hypothetical protein
MNYLISQEGIEAWNALYTIAYSQFLCTECCTKCRDNLRSALVRVDVVMRKMGEKEVPAEVPDSAPARPAS